MTTNYIYRAVPCGTRWEIVKNDILNSTNCLLWDKGNGPYIYYTGTKEYILLKKGRYLYFKDIEIAVTSDDNINYVLGAYSPQNIYNLYYILWMRFSELWE